MPEDVFPAHIDPYLVLEPPDVTFLGKVGTIRPAAERLHVPHPIRNVYVAVGDFADNGHRLFSYLRPKVRHIVRLWPKKRNAAPSREPCLRTSRVDSCNIEASFVTR